MKFHDSTTKIQSCQLVKPKPRKENNPFSCCSLDYFISYDHTPSISRCKEWNSVSIAYATWIPSPDHQTQNK